MRYLKFRGFCKAHNKMVFGDLIKDGSKWFITNLEGATRTYFDCDKESVGQFTGLKDKNGVDVYESDIVKIPEARRNYTVEFDDYGFKLIHANPVLNRMVWGGLHRLDEVGFTIEVIGNIHQNPELLNLNT